MRRFLLSLLCVVALLGTQHSEAAIPTKGAIARFTFNTNGASTVGGHYLTDVSEYEQQKGTKCSPSNLSKYIKDGALAVGYDSPHQLRMMPKNHLLAKTQSTVLVRFKLSENHSYVVLFFDGNSYYKCGIDKNCKVRYNCANNKKADKRYDKEYKIDLGIKKGEWTTLVVSFDTTTNKVTFSANGMTQVLDNPAINDEFKDLYITNQYLRFTLASEATKMENRRDPTLLSYVDEFVIYNRVFTPAELISAVGVDGVVAEIDTPLESPEMKIMWPVTAFQMVCAVLIVLLVLARSKNKLPHIVPLARSRDDAQVMEHLKEVYKYWWYDIEYTGALPKEYTSLSYPEKRKELNKSLKEYKKAVAIGTADPEILAAMNLFADVYNSATRFVFEGKWWMFTLPVACVYVREMITLFMEGLGMGGIMPADYVNLPEGTIDQFIYFSHYYLPTVIFSVVVFYVSCYAQRYHSVKGEKILEYDFKPQSIKYWLFVPLGAVALGVLPGLGFIPLLLSCAGILVLGMAGGNLREERVKTTYSDGSTKTHSQIEAGSLGGAMAMIIMAIIAVLVVWLASSIVIYVYHVAFLYCVFKNHFIRKFW